MYDSRKKEFKRWIQGVHNAGNSGKEVASRANLYERDFELLWVIARVAEDLPQFKGID